MLLRSAVRDLQHERSVRVSDKARGKAELINVHILLKCCNRVLHDRRHGLTGLL